MSQAGALHEQAKQLIRTGRLRAGRRLLLRALAIEPAGSSGAAISGTLGYVEVELGNAELGLQLLEEALGVADVDPGTTGTLLAQRSLVLGRLGDSKRALVDVTNALPLLGPGTVDHARALLNRGAMYLDQADVGPAEADFREAAAVFDRVGLPIQAAKAIHNLGYSALLRGEVVGAISSLTRAREVLAPLSAQLAAMSTQDLGEAFLTAGQFDEGTRLLTEARETFRRDRLRRLQGEAEFVLARTLALRSPIDGLRLARRASQTFRALGLEAWRQRCEAIRIACLSELGRADPVQSLQLAADLRRQGLAHDALFVSLLAVRASARAGTPLPLPRIPTLAPPSVRLLAFDVRAERAEARGELRPALAAVGRGVDELLRWQSHYGSLDLQTSLAAHADHYTRRGLALALRLGRPALVHDWVERTGALASRIAPVRPPSDPVAAADLTELRVLAQRQPEPGSAEAERQQELFQRVRQRAWQDEGSATVNRLVPLGRVREELKDTDACLLAPLSARGNAWALVIRGTRSHLVDLGPAERIKSELGGLPADLDLAAADLPPAFSEAVRDTLSDRMRLLDELILGPTARYLTSDRVVINPTGLFSGLPWALMPTLAGRPLTIPRSASAWVTGRQRPHEYALAGFTSGPRLDRAEPEVRRAATYWARSEVLVGAEADSAAVSELAGRADVLHLAAHGHHQADNPLFSYLELVDGPWYGYDLDQLPDIPEVVILSACELGTTTIRRGDELLGLTTAWLHAGARCVIAAPASVSDTVAEAILPDVHAELAVGTMPADALAKATAKHPELISTFQCYGAGW